MEPFQPFGEEIAAGVGMRTSGQGFGATDKIRQRYALTERDDATGLDHTWWRKFENRAGRWTLPHTYRGSTADADPRGSSPTIREGGLSVSNKPSLMVGLLPF